MSKIKTDKTPSACMGCMMLRVKNHIASPYSRYIVPRFRHVEVLEDVVWQRGDEPFPGLGLRHLGATLR